MITTGEYCCYLCGAKKTPLYIGWGEWGMCKSCLDEWMAHKALEQTK